MMQCLYLPVEVVYKVSSKFLVISTYFSNGSSDGPPISFFSHMFTLIEAFFPPLTLLLFIKQSVSLTITTHDIVWQDIFWLAAVWQLCRIYHHNLKDSIKYSSQSSSHLPYFWTALFRTSSSFCISKTTFHFWYMFKYVMLKAPVLTGRVILLVVQQLLWLWI